MADLDLCYLSGAEALALFRARKLSPVELLEAQTVRAGAVEATINAFAWTFFDEALAAARQAEKRYGEGSARPLEGLTLAVKEDTAVAGRPQSAGSLIFRDRIAAETHPAVERLLGAGAICHALTACPEFVWPWTCTSRLHGVTRNPWNPAMTCGASSGGAAAAMAAGTATLATGSDSAGSIRVPAALCAIAGYKPPYGRNPASPEVAMDAFFHVGPMTRGSGDAALMQNAMAGRHPRDHATLPETVVLPPAPPPVAGMRIAWSMDLGAYTVCESVRRNTGQALAALRDAGAALEEIATPWAGEAARVAGFWGGLVYADEFTEAVARHGNLVCDYTRVFARQNEAVTPAMFHDCMKTIGAAWARFGPLLAGFDAFLCPTFGATDIAADWRDWEQPIVVDGAPCDVHDTVLTFPFNLFSRCPALSVPSGFAPSGVATGVQIVANPYDDAACFRVARALEAALPLYGPGRPRPSCAGPARDQAEIM